MFRNCLGANIKQIYLHQRYHMLRFELVETKGVRQGEICRWQAKAVGGIFIITQRSADCFCLSFFVCHINQSVRRNITSLEEARLLAQIELNKN